MNKKRVVSSSLIILLILFGVYFVVATLDSITADTPTHQQIIQ
jgi:hypothetical protein